MKTGHYINKEKKLQKSLDKYLTGLKIALILEYGEEKTQSVIDTSKKSYPDIIPNIPFFDTPAYDSLVILNSRMMALKKGMRSQQINVKDFVGFQIKNLRSKMNSKPKVIRNFLENIFLSKAVRLILKNTARKTTKNGWPTQVESGARTDNFNMKVHTQNCQMVNFMRSVGEEDFIPYCSFADFVNAESLGFSLKQTSTIDSGTCTFCFSKKGDVEWPEQIEELIKQ